ncbi:hypothetical protein QZH41_009177 [Actinostola sp. cb2023]|nr:hypothetical protein QZH41_009177 [Actinostola sp. cb2023]
MADGQQPEMIGEQSFPKITDKEAEVVRSVSAHEKAEARKGVGTVSTDTGARTRMISESSLSEDTTTAELQEVCKVSFKKISQYLNGELTATLDDYELLEKLNNLTTTKYQEMTSMAKTLITSMEELDDQYKSLQPYLEQIDKVEESVASLEQAAYRLDSYSKKLGHHTCS